MDIPQNQDLDRVVDVHPGIQWQRLMIRKVHNGQMIVIQFTSPLLEIEAPLPLLDDLFLIKLFAVSWRQVSPCWARH